MTSSVVETTPHRVTKSEAAFRTISEVAEDLDVPQHVLRFWESRFPQIKPLKRGGGRRYYRPADVQLLRRIRDLLYKDGYTIKGVQKLLRDGVLKVSDAPIPESEPLDDFEPSDDLDEPEEPAAADMAAESPIPEPVEPAPTPEAIAPTPVPEQPTPAPSLDPPAPAPAPEPPAPAGLSVAQQDELRAILDDLKSLREFLHHPLT